MSDDVKQAWNEVAESFSALGRMMKQQHHGASEDEVGDSGEPSDAGSASETEATKAAREATAALRAALDQVLAAGRQVGERVGDVARDDEVKAQAKRTASSFEGAMSATVAMIVSEVEGLVKRPRRDDDQPS